MKSVGISRRVDDLGRVVIPKEIRRDLQIRENDPLEIWVDGDMICLRKRVEYDAVALQKAFRMITAFCNCDIHFVDRNGALVATTLIGDKPRSPDQPLYEHCRQNRRVNGELLETASGKKLTLVGYCLVGSQWNEDGGIFVTGSIDEEIADKIAGAVASWMHTTIAK